MMIKQPLGIKFLEMSIFLEGHFKENPVFPASIMIEALGQLCVFYLLKGDHPFLNGKSGPLIPSFSHPVMA
jgi:hypothetical protein